MLGLFIDYVHFAFGGIAVSSNSIVESFLFDLHTSLRLGFPHLVYFPYFGCDGASLLVGVLGVRDISLHSFNLLLILRTGAVKLPDIMVYKLCMI